MPFLIYTAFGIALLPVGLAWYFVKERIAAYRRRARNAD